MYFSQYTHFCQQYPFFCHVCYKNLLKEISIVDHEVAILLHQFAHVDETELIAELDLMLVVEHAAHGKSPSHIKTLRIVETVASEVADLFLFARNIKVILATYAKCKVWTHLAEQRPVSIDAMRITIIKRNLDIPGSDL